MMKIHIFESPLSGKSIGRKEELRDINAIYMIEKASFFSLSLSFDNTFAN